MSSVLNNVSFTEISLRKLKAFLTKDVTSFFVRRFSSFTYLNVTQFLGALNDNIYKLLVVYLCIQLEGIESSYRILSMAGAISILPFLLFSASSGILADRFSKRNIIVLTKFFELVIMIGGIFSFAFESKIGAFFTLFLLSTQSAIFAPSKYGILPELVETEKITKANGLMTSFTFLAIIIGTFCASFLLDMTSRNFLFASLFCGVLSLIGLLTSFCIEYTPPSGSHQRFNVLFLHEIYKTLKIAFRVPSLVAAMLGSSFFLFLGAFLQLNIIPYAVHSLKITDIQGGYLFLLTAIGIGLGSLIAGKISGKSVELGLVPVAGIGMTICCYLLDLLSEHLAIIIPVVLLIGLFGGIYQVPLDSYIQISSPHKHRGQIVAATNFISFFGALCASFLLYAMTEIFGFEADKGFTIMGTITLMVTIAIVFQFFDYLRRFVAMILSKLHFRTIFNGKDNIPDAPVIYLCTHTAWNDTLLLLGAQRRRIRFFIEQEQDHSGFLKYLYRLLGNLPIGSLENDQECIFQIQNLLKKGISVCLLVENPDIHRELEKIRGSSVFNAMLTHLNVPLIPVTIERGSKEKEHKFFRRFLEKIHIPAAISFESLE
ncbi:MAG: MFS transporter [Waddliaceae bacterium]